MDEEPARTSRDQPSVQRQEPGSAGRVLIIEDHTMMAETLALGLSSTGFDSHVAGLDGADALVNEAAAHRPDLVLLDLDLGTADGLDLIPRLHSLGASVLVVTGCTVEDRLAAALALGACGWVSKSEPFERLLDASELAMRDRPLIPASRRAELLENGRAWLDKDRELESRLDSLTDREQEVLASLRTGKSAQEIADELVVSLGTVRTHIRAILTKLGVSTQLAAVAKAGQRVGGVPTAPRGPDRP